jgi:glutaminyl-peptide cyclotransferase
MRPAIVAALAVALALIGALVWSQRADAPPGEEPDTAVPPGGETPTGTVDVVGSIPHEGSVWTEGLLVSDGLLWESTGNPTGSGVRALDPATGEVRWSVSNGNAFFAEGIVRAFGRTYILSWQERTVYLFDRDATPPFRQFATYEGEGWGLTAVGADLVNSNGSADLYYRDPETFEVRRTVTVRYQGSPVERLNELEYDGRYIWVNQWQTRYVYRIDPGDPSQVVRYELPDRCPGGFFNGIAWHPDEQVFYVTGQRCPEILRVRFR